MMMYENNKIHKFGVHEYDYDKFKEHDNKYEEIAIIDNELYCYSIKIGSRYDKLNEILQMIDFCRMAFDNRICQFINSLWYNSKSGACDVILQLNGKLIDTQDVDKDSDDECYRITEIVHYIANKTIDQHFVFGSCDGKAHEDEMFEEAFGGFQC